MTTARGCARPCRQRCQQLGVVHPNAPLTATDRETVEFGVCDPDGNLLTVFERRR